MQELPIRKDRALVPVSYSAPIVLRRTFLTSLLATPLLRAAPDLRWLAIPHDGLEIDGLPWFAKNDGEFFRLPAASKDKFPAPVWNLAKSPSGGRIRLRTDSTALAVRLEYPSPPSMNNMHAFGQTGVDLYSDGAARRSPTRTPSRARSTSMSISAPVRERGVKRRFIFRCISR